MAKNSLYGPWVYSEPIDKSSANVYATYYIYDDKIVDENGSVYNCVNSSAGENGVSVAVYDCGDATYLLRIGLELVVIMEEGDDDYYMELAGESGPQSLLSHQYLLQAQNTSTQTQQPTKSGWEQLADALAQMGNSINQAMGVYSAGNGNKRVQSGRNTTQQASVSAADEWIPTNVLEIYTGLNIRTTHQFHNWYKRFYGNRWCLFTHKGGTRFHVASVNKDRTCAGYDVSRYAYKAIAPTGSTATGTRYYYFN
ncbi:MAG: hypothetical protein ACI4BH_08005 [Muribaculaceae bacterium]